jgi:hypothetical protein
MCRSPLGKYFTEHDFVRHSTGEYGRGDIHTNTVEGFYSVFKRGMKGVYQHCSEKHLHRYVTEFDFRYNNRSNLGVEDAERADKRHFPVLMLYIPSGLAVLLIIQEPIILTSYDCLFNFRIVFGVTS